MFNSGIEQFIIKRLLICFILLSIIDMVVIENKWLVLSGLAAGTFVGAVKFLSNAKALAGILGRQAKEDRVKPVRLTATIIFLLNQIILLPFLFLAYFLGQWVFWGFFAGILIIPLLIMLNSITEAFGITMNHFGEKV